MLCEIILQFHLQHAGFIYTFQIEPGNVVVTEFSKHNIASAAATEFPRKSNSDSSRKTELYHMGSRCSLTWDASNYSREMSDKNNDNHWWDETNNIIAASNILSDVEKEWILEIWKHDLGSTSWAEPVPPHKGRDESMKFSDPEFQVCNVPLFFILFKERVAFVLRRIMLTPTL